MKAWLYDDPENKLIRNAPLLNLSTLIHFGAELSIAPLFGVPLIKQMFFGGSYNPIEPFYYLGAAVGLNLVCQPIAFYAKAKALTSEGNYEMAKLFAHKSVESRKRDKTLVGFLDKKLANLHWYFAKK